MDTNAPPGRSPDSDNEDSEDPDHEGDIPSAYGPIAMDVINDHNHVVPGERNNWPSASSMAAFTSSNSATGTVEEMARSRSLPIQDHAADRNNESAIVTEIRMSYTVICHELRQLRQAVLNGASVPSSNQRPTDQSPPGQHSVYVPPGGNTQVRPTGNVDPLANTQNGPFLNAEPISNPRQWRLANIISSDHRRYLLNLHLNREIDRLATFSRWPIARPNVAPVDVARAGFFYLGDMDRTQCFSCGRVLRNWAMGDNAMDDHCTHFPNCKFVLGTDRRNVPVPLIPESQEQLTVNYPCRHPINPHMRSESKRLSTFDSRWPCKKIQATPQQIAEAGFIYLGERDQVKCWYCNGGIQNWEYDDLPWVEHAKWFPSCQFLLNRKGQRFVYHRLSASPSLPRPVIGRQIGATIDPVEPEQEQRQDIPPQIIRAATPPPTIIDPQEEARPYEEKIDKEMHENSSVRLVIEMGFPEEVVRSVLEERLDYLMSSDDQMGHIRTSIFDNIEHLIDTVQEKEAEMKREAEEREATMPKQILRSTTMLVGTQVPTNAAYPTTLFGFDPDDDDEIEDLYGSYPDDDDREIEDLYGGYSHRTSGAPPITAPTSSTAMFGNDTPEDPVSLQEMIERRTKEGLCKICYTEPANVLFTPCSHMCCCKNCTEAIRYCPLCRKKVEKAIITFFA